MGRLQSILWQSEVPSVQLPAGRSPCPPASPPPAPEEGSKMRTSPASVGGGGEAGALAVHISDLFMAAAVHFWNATGASWGLVWQVHTSM